MFDDCWNLEHSQIIQPYLDNGAWIIFSHPCRDSKMEIVPRSLCMSMNNLVVTFQHDLFPPAETNSWHSLFIYYYAIGGLV